MNEDWPALGLNNVEHSFGTKFGASTNPFLQKALKDQKKSGNCFAYSMLWCRQGIKLNRKLQSKNELITHMPLMVAAQAMQSQQVRQNKKGAYGPEGMLGEAYYQAMAAAFCVSARGGWQRCWIYFERPQGLARLGYQVRRALCNCLYLLRWRSARCSGVE
ncbi:hypothetical protein [Pseudomonas kilonensis]